jgi:hypothetical protein
MKIKTKNLRDFIIFIRVFKARFRSFSNQEKILENV